MKNKLLKSILVLICVTAMVLGSVMVVQADEMKEVITGEHNITISPQEPRAGYVYIDAQVPNGWGGEIQVSFHSRSTGKDHICTMSYIENEYHTGIWLPAGAYNVAPQLTMDDGLCQLQLKDSSQKAIQVKKGEDLYLTILAVETSEDEPTPNDTTPIVLPKPQEDYNDLPTEMSNTTTDETIPTQTDPQENQEENSNSLGRIIRIVAIILVIIVATLTIIYAVREHQKEQANF